MYFSPSTTSGAMTTPLLRQERLTQCSDIIIPTCLPSLERAGKQVAVRQPCQINPTVSDDRPLVRSRYAVFPWTRLPVLHRDLARLSDWHEHDEIREPNSGWLRYCTRGKGGLFRAKGTNTTRLFPATTSRLFFVVHHRLVPGSPHATLPGLAQCVRSLSQVGFGYKQ